MLHKCSCIHIGTEKMHNRCHAQPEALTEDSHVCQTDHDWAKTPISFLNCSVLQMASAASGMTSSSE